MERRPQERITYAAALACCSILAFSGCGGDDARDATAPLDAAVESVESAASDERAEALREEARRVDDVLSDSVEDLGDVRSLDSLEEETRAAGDELEAAAERLRALEVDPDQEAARDELADAVAALESDVRDVERAVDDRDLADALREVSSLSVAAVERAVDRVEDEASR